MSIHHVHERLSFGAMDACPLVMGAADDGSHAIVHACKVPCHRDAVGYRGNLPSDHRHYLSLQRDHHLFLNMIDPPVPLFKAESFVLFFNFVDEQIKQRPVFIHCNQGCSRAPSLALLYMAKRLGALPNESYARARGAFEKEYPYMPSGGIAQYLNENWDTLGK